MKALSVRQPWAWLLVNGHKDVENRTWRSNHRGRFFVHASKTIDDRDMAKAQALCNELGITLPSKEALLKQCGGIVGSVYLRDCVTEHDSPWFEGNCYGFVVSKPRKLKFTPYKGRLNFFEVDL